MKRTGIIMAVAILLFLSISSLAHAYNVILGDCWYSDAYEIGRWTSTPTISRIKLNSNTYFYFEDGFLSAISQWSSAGITTINDGTSDSSDIVCYGGTSYQIYCETGYNMPATYTGVTFNYQTQTNTRLGYGGQTYEIMDIYHAIIYIKDIGNNMNMTKNTFIHEVGHSLGWLGHSPFNTDIMYSDNTDIIALTFRDKEHLAQMY